MGKYHPGQDLEMMQDPKEWPIWPHLPLFRYKGGHRNDKEYGFIISFGDGQMLNPKPIVWLGVIGEVKLDRPKIVYESFEALLADGWLVD
jgi:hypothetical protein